MFGNIGLRAGLTCRGSFFRREVGKVKISDVLQLIIALLLGLTLVVSIVNLAVK
jgi:hypothetical protein